MDAQDIKSVGCTRSQNVVTIYLQCTSIKQAEAVFARVRASIDASENGANLMFGSVRISAAEAPAAEAEAAS